MRIALVVALLLALLPAAAQAVDTRVWISGQHPLVVRGAGFRAGERVTVTVTKGAALFRKKVTTTRGGAFRAAWLKPLPTVCANTKVVALGASGRRAEAFVVADDCGPPTR